MSDRTLPSGDAFGTPDTGSTAASVGDLFVFPASFAQSRLWFIEEVAPGRSTYNIPVALRFRGPVDIAALQSAIDQLVSRQDALRTTFEVDHDDLMQVVHPVGAATLDLYDFSGSADAAARARDALGVEANRTFDLRRGPVVRFALLRVTSDEHLFLVSVHHIVADGWSMRVLLRELAESYSAAREGRPAVLPELPVQYADFAVWQREQLAGDSRDRLEDYWRERLRAPLPTLELPWRASRNAALGARPAGHWQFRIPDAVAGRIRALARAERATDFMAYLAAFQLLLARYAGHDDVIVGTPMSGRGSRELEPLIGLFLNTLALRTDLSGDPSFRLLLRRAREVALGAFANEAVPFERIVDIVKPVRDLGRTPIFQAVFSMQNVDTAMSGEEGPAGPVFAGLEVERVATMLEDAKFDLQLTITPDGSSYHGSLQYDADLLDDAVMRRLAGHFVTLLHGISDAPDAHVGTLTLLDEPEGHLVLGEWNGTTSPYPSDATVHELFEAQSAARPDAVAVVAGDESVTYADLASRARALAQRLCVAGIRPGQFVGLCAERSVDMLVAMLAILEAGCAYVPLDPQYPPARLSLMLTDATAPVMLVQPGTAGAAEAALALSATRGDAGGGIVVRPRLLVIEDHAPAEKTVAPSPARIDDRPASERPAYVMYTSGSTGSPKGVVVPHRAIVRLVRGADYVDLGPDEVLLAFATASFDASTFEIWGALLNGARLVLAPSNLPALVELGNLIERHGVTTLWLTSALFQQVVDNGLEQLRGVRQLLAGGDVLSVPHVRRVLAALPDCRLINGYGPTENTTFTCCFPVPRDWPADRSIPIGRPIANSLVYILDDAQRPVAVGVPGELYAGGDGVAIGYVNDPELTAECFLPDPFSTSPGARMYRTGDRVRWREGGLVEFLGRIDAQVKIRGFRVEPGEIEAAMLSHPGIRAAAVTPTAASGSEKQLVAYYSLHDGERLSAQDIRAWLRGRLPAYMVPAHFEHLPAIPVGPTGKVNRSALPEPTSTGEAASAYVAARTPIERELVLLWESLLPAHPIGIHDDFFELGGHSLLAMRMIAQIERQWNRKLPLRMLLEHPTVAQTGALIRESLNEDDAPGAVVLQKDGPGTPLAFVHGDLLGAGWYCRRLAPLLGESPLIVLETFGPGPHATIESMASAHIASLRKAQPTGPYRIGGFCVGGLVAYEMARQLSARGETVEIVVVVDAVCRNVRFRWMLPVIRVLTRAPTEAGALDRRVKLYLSLHYYARKVAQFRRMRFSERAHEAWSFLRRRLNRGKLPAATLNSPAVRAVRPGRTDAPAAAADAAEVARVAKFVFTRWAQRGYMPGRYAGRVHLVRASGFIAGRAWVERGGGFERVAGDLHLHTVPGGHDDLVMPDGVPTLASSIRRSLDRLNGCS